MYKWYFSLNKTPINMLTAQRILLNVCGMLGEYPQQEDGCCFLMPASNNTMIQTRCYPSSMLCIRLWYRLTLRYFVHLLMFPRWNCIRSETSFVQECFPNLDKKCYSYIVCLYFIGMTTVCNIPQHSCSIDNSRV